MQDSNIKADKETFLAPCPKTANCVSSEHQDLNRRMMPVSFDGATTEEAMEYLVDILSGLPKTTIEKQEHHYIHAVAKTTVMEFYHDVEFYLDEAAKQVHFRSASRIGLTDFGTNKRRLQAIIARFLRKMMANKQGD
ncbi:DUF1499 domain-containing protein [Tuberibacillus sp. Marseille-P3662]|uniref:DUF1499 domain-containing protein n=1 Tax=Tuberibacillus sp. Marseille-P3662 TaxID=1965358 RepID=UPI000A1CC8BC|nr:DUF1499 domain-containing protein [Tuberibacillus sp. Marseille-P3662]